MINQNRAAAQLAFGLHRAIIKTKIYESLPRTPKIDFGVNDYIYEKECGGNNCRIPCFNLSDKAF
ncbi:MAG: hypothetical protein EBT98_05075 [Opitutaceae bacterium]|nr:hypothetical protein [Opitutaceae bacterium]NBR57866.1 hypothetical protein [Opitutaceae bacterium]